MVGKFWSKSETAEVTKSWVDSRIMLLINRLLSNKLNEYTINNKYKLEYLKANLAHCNRHYLEKQKARVDLLVARIKSIDPTLVLKRGFSITKALPSDTVITDVREVAVGQAIKVVLSKGALLAEVNEIIEKEH